MIGPAEIFAPLGGVAFTGFHAALGRWLLAGTERPDSRRPGFELPSTTLLVPARNEEANLRRLLPVLFQQDYPTHLLQIVVVNDRSTDGTSQVVQELGQGRVDLVEVADLPDGIGPKKNAILQGLGVARGEIVLQLDADTSPGLGWVRAMAGSFEPRTGAVCGLVFHAPAEAGVPGWFHGIWALEALGWAAVQDAAIRNGIPISAHGGNLAYRRKAFDSVGGFGKHGAVVSGDDDFLVQSLSDSGRWEVLSTREPSTQVTTRGPSSWSIVWEQRKRWSSKCVRYDAKRVLLLSGIYASYAWIALLLLVSISSPSYLPWALLPLAAFALEAWFLVRSMARKSGRTGLLIWFPLAAAVQVPLVLAATFAGTFGRFRWKDGWTTAARGVR